MNNASPDPRYQALIQLLRTAETIWNSSHALFARWNLSPSQFNILNLLHGLPGGMNQIELSRQLLMHRSNVTGLVDRLEQRRLVQRCDTPGDRRAYLVVLTATGRKLMAEILPHYYRASEEVWAGLPPEQAEQLVAQLAEVSSNAERMSAELSHQPQS
jgi:DNA-binding MarR family transcriptional regulator